VQNGVILVSYLDLFNNQVRGWNCVVYNVKINGD
jgi:hypothetical protein